MLAGCVRLGFDSARPADGAGDLAGQDAIASHDLSLDSGPVRDGPVPDSAALVDAVPPDSIVTQDVGITGSHLYSKPPDGTMGTLWRQTGVSTSRAMSTVRWISAADR